MTAPGLHLAFEPRTEKRQARQFVIEFRQSRLGRLVAVRGRCYA